MKPIRKSTFILLLTFGLIFSARGSLLLPKNDRDTIIPTHIVTLRELIKNRESLKAQLEINARKDSTIAAQAEQVRIADSIKIEHRAQLLYQAKIETVQAEKENLYKARVGDLEKENRRLRIAPWIAAAATAIITGFVALMSN